MKNSLDLTYLGNSLPAGLDQEATIYHSDQWLGLLAAYYGYKAAPERFERNGKIVAYAPLVEIDNLTGRKLRSPPASMYGEILAESAEDELAFVEELRARSLSSNRRLLVKTIGDRALPLAEISREIDCRVPLEDEDSAWEALHSSARRAVRKSRKVGVNVSSGRPEQLRPFFSLLVKTRRRLGLPVAPFRWMQQVLSSPFAGFLVATYGQDVVAGILYLYDHNYVHYALPAYSDNATKVSAMDACIWELIRRSCDGEKRWLGMGGSPESNTGLRRFKRKWGGEERVVRLLADSASKATTSHQSGGVSSIVRHAPGPVLQALGYIYLRFLQ